MRKFTTTLLLVSMVVFAFGQWTHNSSFTSKKLERSDKNPVEIKNVTAFVDNQLKDINANVIFEEDFETAWPPAGWSIVDGTFSTEHWRWYDGDQFGSNGTKIAYCKWELVANGQDEQMITPTITIPSTGLAYQIKLDWLLSHYWMVDPNDNADFFIKISDDAGTTWDTLFWENDSAMCADAGITDWPWETYEWYTAYLDISAYMGSDVIFMIQYEGSDGASAYVDNVMVFEVPQYDIAFNGMHPNMRYTDGGYLTMIPYKFSQPLVNWAYIRNGGLNDATNVYMKAEVDDGSGVVYADSSVAIATFAAQAEDSIGLPTIFYFNDVTPVTVDDLKTYTIDYTLISDQTDEFPNDNLGSFEFEITESIFARDNDNPLGFPFTGPQTWVDGGGDGDMFGVRYDITDTCEINSLTFHVSSYSEIGASIRGILYYDDGSTISPLLYTDMLDIDSTHLGQWITLDYIKDQFSEFIDTNISQTYIAGLEIFYNGSEFWISEDNMTPSESFATFWYLINDTGTEWFYASNYSATPYIRLNIESYLLPSGIPENSAATQNIHLYPNPSQGIINISNVENATVEVYNLVGERLIVENNVSNTINISELPEGNYVIKIVTEEFATTRKISIVK